MYLKNFEIVFLISSIITFIYYFFHNNNTLHRLSHFTKPVSVYGMLAEILAFIYLGGKAAHGYEIYILAISVFFMIPYYWNLYQNQRRLAKQLLIFPLFIMGAALYNGVDLLICLMIGLGIYSICFKLGIVLSTFRPREHMVGVATLLLYLTPFLLAKYAA